MVTHDNPFRQCEHSITFVGISVSLITLAIARVIVNQQVTEVKQPAGSKHARDFSKLRPLLITVRYAGQHSKEHDGIDGIISERQRASIGANQSRAWQLRSAAREHSGGKVNPNSVLITCLIKFCQRASVATPVIENTRSPIRTIQVARQQVQTQWMREALLAGDAIPVSDL